jgi:DNA processing protein
LKADGRTLAVLGGAMDCLYPPENDGLAREIAGRGAVLSEFVLGRRPDKTTFPIRNRIVSGLSAGVVVVEAAPRSGALITAARAAEQGRTVFAVPGRIDNRGALGPHGLIRDGARLVQSVEDILEELQSLLPPGAARVTEGLAGPGAGRAALDADETAVLACLADGERGVDDLIRLSGLGSSRVSGLLVKLEMKRRVRMLPGRMVESI